MIKSCPDIDNLILLSEMYNVTLDELIKGNQNIKEKIHIDEEDEDFEKENDFGFYIGFGLLIMSAFIDYEKNTGGCISNCTIHDGFLFGCEESYFE